MKKPLLSELAHYAEIAAAIRSSTMQAVADSSDVALQNQAANEDLTRIRMMGDAGISVLTELEATRYMSFNRGMWIRMQNIYAQQKLGVLDASFWGTYLKIICDIYTPPGIRATWTDHTGVLDPDFIKFVESCVD